MSSSAVLGLGRFCFAPGLGGRGFFCGALAGLAFAATLAALSASSR
jgi:hypothetical protein